MMKNKMKYLFILVFLSFNTIFSQSQNLIKHKVAKGETVTIISKKYNVTPFDIYKLNPDAQNGVSENTILIIPNKAAAKAKTFATSTPKKHVVLPKETLFGISKQYNTSIEAIEKLNADALKEGVKIGMTLLIPAGNAISKTEVKKEVSSKTPVYHEVQPKETKYGIAKQYGITSEQLEKQNPEIVAGLPVGFKLLISGEIPVKTPKAIVTPTETPKPTEAGYVVKPKETIYSLSNQFGVTQEELIALNPALKDGVQEGMTLKVPTRTIAEAKKEYKDLTKTYKTQTNKNLALLLPFNITRLDQDTINSTKARLKKDKFLNMTLDFYAGALIAIDSVKKMGLNVDVTILDSDETKSTSNINNLIQKYDLKNMDAVIGPFYQNNVEKTAELLSPYNVPVISPLSKDYDKRYANLIQSTPSTSDVKAAMFDFMRSKGGNIIAVIDPKKGSVKQYISENHKDVLFADFNDKGGLDIAKLKSVLVKDKMNFVIMETERTNLILSTTTALQSAMAEYQIRLVILGENEALDYEEIEMSRLTKLRMHYPSLTRVNESDEASIFDSTFKKKNKVVPNQFATRGFDVTFDVLMRLSQEKPFIETLNDAATEQVENKFYYVANPDGGYTNKGIYILYYDTDLTVKEAK
ncbi:LysM peptidoglycan-binding domain-containing protein [Flavobacterium sp.]|uniref:PBP1 and LysM peptidoglycan-binding domain-containing protein n=1 Tax=Flavobacterium sp. TaxID=239 RepID=UPI0026289F99|nr:LysM peptidoglycan-binding domain-containing protein [Flavobacterium sp.]